MNNNKPYWMMLKEAAEQLTDEGKVPFSRKQLVEKVQEKDPEANPGTLNPMIQGITVGLKGGAPGAVEKKILKKVGRGRLKLNDSGSKDEKKEENEDEKEQVENKSNKKSMVKKTSESDIRDLVMRVLYENLGKDKGMNNSGKYANFKLKDGLGSYHCYAERSLSYGLPKEYELTHNNDILIASEDDKRYVSIEIKHKSAVTDQFKCRSYDMLHMKNEYGEDLLGVLVYVKADRGISPNHAEKICHPFDVFYHVPTKSREDTKVWDDLVSMIEDFLKG